MAKFKVIDGFNTAHEFPIGTEVTLHTRQCAQYQMMVGFFGEEAMANTEAYIDDAGRVQLLDSHEVVSLELDS